MLFNPKTNKVERIKGSNGLNVNCFSEDGEDILIGADEGIYKINMVTSSVGKRFKINCPTEWYMVY